MEILELIEQIRKEYGGFCNTGSEDIIRFVLEKQIPKEAEWDEDGWLCPS